MLNVGGDEGLVGVIETADITDPAAAAVFANPRQRRILLSLVQQERSLTELAGLTGAPLNLLHHHMRKLMSLGLVAITRRQARAGAPIKFYRATASRFFVPADFGSVGSGDPMSVRLRNALDRSLADTLSGVLYSHDDAGPRMRLVRKAPSRATATELWLDLQLSDADAAALADEFKALLKRFEPRARHSGRRYIVHAAVVHDPQ